MSHPATVSEASMPRRRAIPLLIRSLPLPGPPNTLRASSTVWGGPGEPAGAAGSSAPAKTSQNRILRISPDLKTPLVGILLPPPFPWESQSRPNPSVHYPQTSIEFPTGCLLVTVKSSSTGYYLIKKVLDTYRPVCYTFHYVWI